MTTEELVAKAKEFCEREYMEYKTCYNIKSSLFYHNDSAMRVGLQHCLAIVQFIQTCGVKYKDVSWYNDYRKKFYEISKNI